VLPPTHPLIEAVVEPLSDNVEQKLAAIAMLGETFDTEHPAIPETLDRFEKVDSQNHHAFWKWILPALAGISIVAMGIVLTPQIRAIVTLNSYLGSSTMFTPPPVSRRADLTPEQNLLLGDPRKSSIEQKEDLIQSDPSRPDFYADYLYHYLIEFKKLPDDYFETIARIDPDNAFFLYVGAAVIGKDSVEKIPRTEDQKNNNESIKYTILDETRLANAMALFRKARELPKFNNYVSSLLASRIPLLKQRNMAEKVASIGYVAGHPSIAIRLRELGDMISARAAALSNDKDTEALHGVLRDNEHFLKVWSDSPVGSLVDELVLNVVAASTTTATYDAAIHLDLVREAELLAARKRQFDERILWRKKKNHPDDSADISIYGGMLHNLALPMVSRQVKKPMSISKEDLKPGRLIDHEIASRIFASLAFIILILASFTVFLFRFRASPLYRKISARIELLLTKTDWAWILCIGVILPFLYVILINRFTPLGGREYGIKGLGLIFPFIHYLLLLLSILSTPVLIIRWRLRTKTEAFSFSHRESAVGWIILLIGLILVPCAYPLAMSIGADYDDFRLLLVIPFLWKIAILVTCCRALFGKPELRITRAAAARSLIPAYALGILLFASLFPIFDASERHWNSHDRLMTLDPKYPGMTPYEYKVGAQLREEVKGMLGF